MVKIFFLFIFISFNSFGDDSSNDWTLSLTTTVPLRGFTIQAGGHEAGVQDKIQTINYNASANLEGSIGLRYKQYGFTYSGNLIKSNNIDPARTETHPKVSAFRAGIFFDNKLLEISTQKNSGYSTDIAVDTNGTNKSIIRPDITYSDYHINAMYGVPINSSVVSTLSNFYNEVSPTQNSETTYDLLYNLEISKESIKANSPFVPEERKSQFGSASTLNMITSYGLGAGIGGGFTAPTTEKSNISLAALIGANINYSKAYFAQNLENVSGTGVYAKARLTSNFFFGSKFQYALVFRFLLDAWNFPAKENEVNSSDALLDFNLKYFF